MQRVPTASRRLLVLVFALAGLALPSAAGSQTSFSADRHEDGTLGANGWYVSNVHVYWTFDPPPDNDPGCSARTLVTDGVTHFDCTATWGQTTFHDVFDVSIDKTPPTASGQPARPPDSNGWYNNPVGVSFSGSDATSGVAGLLPRPTAGPDSASAQVVRHVHGQRGQRRHARSGSPTTRPRRPSQGDGSKPGSRSVVLGWAASPDTQRVQVTRSQGTSASRASIYTRHGRRRSPTRACGPARSTATR